MKELLEIFKYKDLTFNTFYLLKIIGENSEYEFPDITHRYPNEYITLLALGYLDTSYKITQRGQEVLKKVEMGIRSEKKQEVNKYEQLLIILQADLKLLTGNKQKTVNKYPFLPNLIDFELKLKKVERKYKLESWEKLTTCLREYVKKCHKNKWEYIKLLKYYIDKDNQSDLASDYFNLQEEIIEKTPKTFEI